MMVLRCVRSRKIQRRVEERIRAGKCLGILDDGSECDGKPTKLGLCQHCHSRFYNVLKTKPYPDQLAYRQKLIMAGRMLQDREILTLKKQSFWNRMA